MNDSYLFFSKSVPNSQRIMNESINYVTGFNSNKYFKNIS